MSTTIRAARLPQTDPDQAAVTALVEYEALASLLRSLDPVDWDRPTDCTHWTVRDIVAHVLGALHEGAFLPTFIRHALTARFRHRELSLLDGMNEAQIDDRRGWSGPRLVAELARLAPIGVSGRRRVPGFVRQLRPPPNPPMASDTRMSYVLDVIYTRDAWMHRVDITRAVGRVFQPGPSDAEVVEQVVRDLDRQWSGPPLVLHLSGSGGGRWTLSRMLIWPHRLFR